MARNVLFKFFAILLAAALLLTSLASGAAIIGLAASDLYSKTPDDMYRQMMEGRLESLAHSLVQRYLGEELGNCPDAYLDNRFNQYYSHPFNDFNPGKVYSTAALYETVWKEAALGSEGAVAVHIRHLREKIEINPSEPRYLKVVWGQGYKMEGGR